MTEQYERFPGILPVSESSKSEMLKDRHPAIAAVMSEPDADEHWNWMTRFLRGSEPWDDAKGDASLAFHARLFGAYRDAGQLPS